MHRHHPFASASVTIVCSRRTGQDAIRIQVKRPPQMERTDRGDHQLARTAYAIAAQLEQHIASNVALHPYEVRVTAPQIGLVTILLPLTGGVLHTAEDLAVEACLDCGLEAEHAGSGPLPEPRCGIDACEDCGVHVGRDYFSAADCNQTGRGVVLCQPCALAADERAQR